MSWITNCLTCISQILVVDRESLNSAQYCLDFLKVLVQGPLWFLTFINGVISITLPSNYNCVLFDSDLLLYKAKSSLDVYLDVQEDITIAEHCSNANFSL